MTEFVATGLPSWLLPATKNTTVFTEYTFDRAMSEVAIGVPLAKACRDNDDLPNDYHRFLRWIHADKKREEEYYEAQRIGAEVMADDVIDIADGTDNPLEDVQRSKLRVDTRMKLIAARNRRYGEKRQIEQNVTVDISDAMSKARERAKVGNVIDLTEYTIENKP